MNNWLFFIFLFLFSCHDTPYVQGKRLYQSQCAHCHMDDGSGLSNLIPDLKKSTLTRQPEFVCLLVNGKKDSIISGDTYILKEMPSFRHLSTTEMTNIINYINHAWFDHFREKTITETSQEAKSCLNN